MKSNHSSKSGGGSILIFVSNFISFFITVVSGIFIIRMLSPEEYGIYTIVTIPSSAVLILGDWGINSALITYISKYRLDDHQNELLVATTGILSSLILGLILSFATYFFSNYLSLFFFNDDSLSELIKITSMVVFSTILYNTCWAVFIGYEHHGYGATLQISYSILKNLISIFLIHLNMGVSGAVLGMGYGGVISSLIGFVLILIYFYYPKYNYDSKLFFSASMMRLLLLYGIPLAISSIFVGLCNRIYDYILVNNVVVVEIGYYGVALNAFIIINLISSPIKNMLLPTFSKYSYDSRDLLESLFRYSIKYTALFVIPISIGLMVLAPYFVTLLFGYEYSPASNYVVLLSVGGILIGLGQQSIGGLLESQGRTDIFMRFSVISRILSIITAFILIRLYGVYGLILNNLLTQITGMILAGYWIVQIYRFKFWGDICLPILTSSLLMGSVVYSFIYCIKIRYIMDNSYFLILMAIIVGVLSYSFFILALRGVDNHDMLFIKNSTVNYPIIGSIVSKSIYIIQKYHPFFKS